MWYSPVYDLLALTHNIKGTHMTYIITLAVLVAIAVLAGRFLGWDSCRKQDDAEQAEYLSKWSDAQRAKRGVK